MGEVTITTEHVARRKQGACSICGTTIDLGQKYQRWRYFDQGDASTVTVHPDCWDLMQEHDIREWTVGDTLQELLWELTPAEASVAVANCADASVGMVWLELRREGENE